MHKNPKLAQSQIEVALFQSRKPIPPDIVDAFPVIDDWFAVADNDIPHIYGIASYPLQAPRPILTAAVIGIEAMPGLVIRCLDGCYRLGHPARVDDKICAVGDNHSKGRISWPRFQRLVEAFLARLSAADDRI
ncbi:MAG: hypothetical protein U0934_20775 [Pseudotabrizicola sp.]|uniref:hypothetical protein n=1 Tax=Pseudotabrizicola sp. TaxID=2939647 RepID=UPI0027309C71|nr:hypothetical protein [Pseudotabrizicola sp.]MDP2079590.1 hypothetical protein [Pseudotabrizicola sp.]MDZ7576359.1 hypothetical protein [Pseudotabrizicola sp.]